MSNQPNSSLITYHNFQKLDKNVHLLTLRVGVRGGYSLSQAIKVLESPKKMDFGF